MAFRIFKIFNARRCTACRRSKRQAISEQAEKGILCDLEHCDFIEDIERNILFALKPTLRYFNADKTEIVEGEFIEISWELIDANMCMINGIGDVPLKGNYTISLEESVELILISESYKKQKSIEGKIPVSVFPKPSIPYFSISKNDIIKGEEVGIQWQTENCKKVYFEFDNKKIDVEHSGTITIVPEMSISIILHGIGALNSNSFEEDLINVFPKTKLDYFSLNKDKVLEGDDVTINWEVENVSRVELRLDELLLSHNVDSNIKEYSFTPNLNSAKSEIKEVRLLLYNLVGDLFDVFTKNIVVLPKPLIHSFNLDKSKILYGEELSISWKVNNYSEIKLINNSGTVVDVTRQNEFLIIIEETTTFQLCVIGLSGTEEFLSIEKQVDVLHPVELNFDSNNNFTIQSLPIILTWTTNHAKSIILKDEDNKVLADNLPNIGSVEVYPKADYTYRLIANNELSYQEKNVNIHVYPIPKISNIALPELPDLTQNISFDDGGSSDKLKKETKIEYSSKLNSTHRTKSAMFDFIKSKIASDKITEKLKKLTFYE